jgi:tRNA pseudouridine55 synthase
VKLQQWLTDGDKTYEALIAFGAATTTEDGEGEVTARGDASGLTADAVRAALPALTGVLDQIPPMYSAVRVGGRRLHEAARAGEEVDRAPRRVVVHALTLGTFEAAGADGRARAHLTVRCGKGTYVRTLAADLGRALGVPAHLAALRRTEASGFRIEGAIPLEEAEALARTDAAALRARLVSPADALAFLPAVSLDAAETRALAQGKRVRRDAPACDLVRALGPGGDLVALCAPTPEGLKPVRVLVTPGEL